LGAEVAVVLALSALLVYFVFRDRVPLVVLILLVVMLSPIVAFVSIMIVLNALATLLLR
jgi:hypothetical protein